MEELAIFGGKPVRENKIFYGRQYIDQADVDAVAAVMTSDLITCGPKVKELEEHLCELTHAKYAVVVCNGTAALHLAALAAGFGEGDEVIVSSITFAASSNCVLYAGAKPVFADINPETYNIDPASIRKLITPRTKAIVAVDFTGQAVELDEIRAICKEHNLLLIEDAAHAIGTTYKGQPVGSLADMTCFSFHPVKTVTGGEGGAITTNDEKLYRHLMRLRTHGITRDPEEMVHPTDALWYNEQVELGFNYRMTDFQAALLLSQLKKLPMFRARRKEIKKRYDEAFGKMPELIRYDQIASYEEYLDETPAKEPGQEPTLNGGGLKLKLVQPRSITEAQTQRGMRPHPYIKQELVICFSKRDRREIGYAHIAKEHLDHIFGVHDNETSMFGRRMSTAEERELKGQVGMISAMGAVASAAMKGGQLSEQEKARFVENINLANDAQTGGMAVYSRRADEAFAKVQ